MKKSILTTLVMALLLSGSAVAQDQIIQLTSFEDYNGAYTGGNIMASFAIDMPDQGVPALDGDVALLVEYDNGGSAWQWNDLSFGQSFDLTGMTEIHMSVYVHPDLTGGNNFQVRLDLPGGLGLGTRTVPPEQYGEWVELVWKIDHINSLANIASVGSFGGFIHPDSGDNFGTVYIDNIFAMKPDGTPDEYDELVVWSLDEEDPDTVFPVGWQPANGPDFYIGEGEVTPSEGSNYGIMYLTDGWVQNVQTSNALGDFDRWDEVFEVMCDIRIPADLSASWINFQLVIQSSGNGWDAYGEMAIADATNDWKTLLWVVDMDKHAAAFGEPDPENPPWFQLSFTTNQDSAAAGGLVFMDNVRLVVPKTTSVNDWSLF
jgi:hypothetical protein